MKSSKRSWLQEVYLTDEDSYLNCWQAAFPDPQLRLEYEGFPIPVSMAWGRWHMCRGCDRDVSSSCVGSRACPGSDAVYALCTSTLSLSFLFFFFF